LVDEVDKERVPADEGERRRLRRGRGGSPLPQGHICDVSEDAIEGWVAARGEEEGPLLYPINKGDRIQRRRMSEQAIYDILRRLGGEMKAKSFAPHDMRRTSIGDLLDAGADLSAAQQLAGHASVRPPRGTGEHSRGG
jgi:integrase